MKTSKSQDATGNLYASNAMVPRDSAYYRDLQILNEHLLVVIGITNLDQLTAVLEDANANRWVRWAGVERER